MEKLRDIKDIVEVHDSSLEILLALVFSIITILAIFTYLYKNRRKRKKRATKRELALNSLKPIDYTNPKEMSYRFTIDGALFINDTNRDEFKEIESSLVQYKYRKDIPTLDEKLKKRVQNFIEGLK